MMTSGMHRRPFEGRHLIVSLGLFSFHQPPSLCLFFLFLRPYLIHGRMPDRGRAFVHRHTFLQSWSGSITLVVGLLHGATFLSIFLLFSLCLLLLSPRSWGGHLFNPNLLPPTLCFSTTCCALTVLCMNRYSSF